MPIQPADERSAQRKPIIDELLPVHRMLDAPAYVPPLVASKEVEAKSIFHLLSGREKAPRAAYLFRTLNIDPHPPRNVSWGRLFGNFMGTVAAFGILLDTARPDERGYVSQRDSNGIIAMVTSLQAYRRSLINAIASEKRISYTMRRSAEFSAGLIDNLQDIFLTPEHRVFLGPGGGPRLRSKIGEQNIRSWIEGEYTGDLLIQGSSVVFTPEGLAAFKRWVADKAHPIRFLQKRLPHQDEVLGDVRQMSPSGVHSELDRFGDWENVRQPHPRYASAVSWVLKELMGIAETHGISLLQARNNRWRPSLDIRVPTAEVDRFIDAVRLNEQLGSLRGEHDWWVDRLGRQANIVIPTQPAIHFARFEKLALQLWKDVDALDEQLGTLSSTANFDTTKLNLLLLRLDQVEGMRSHLEQLRKTDPLARTQENYAVAELCARLIHVMRHYRVLKKHVDSESALRLQIQKCLDSNVFSLLEHIPATVQRQSIPRTPVQLPDTRPEVIPVEWITSHQLITRLFQLKVSLTGGYDVDNANTVDVNTFYTWDDRRSQIVITNKDGRMVNYLQPILTCIDECHRAGEPPDPAIIPNLVREILILSQRAAPHGRMISVNTAKNQIYVPIKVATPSETHFINRYPGLLRGAGTGTLVRGR